MHKKIQYVKYVKKKKCIFYVYDYFKNKRPIFFILFSNKKKIALKFSNTNLKGLNVFIFFYIF